MASCPWNTRGAAALRPHAFRTIILEIGHRSRNILEVSGARLGVVWIRPRLCPSRPRTIVAPDLVRLPITVNNVLDAFVIARAPDMMVRPRIRHQGLDPGDPCAFRAARRASSPISCSPDACAFRHLPYTTVIWFLDLRHYRTRLNVMFARVCDMVEARFDARNPLRLFHYSGGAGRLIPAHPPERDCRTPKRAQSPKERNVGRPPWCFRVAAAARSHRGLEPHLLGRISHRCMNRVLARALLAVASIGVHRLMLFLRGSIGWESTTDRNGPWRSIHRLLYFSSSAFPTAG